MGSVMTEEVHGQCGCGTNAMMASEQAARTVSQVCRRSASFHGYHTTFSVCETHNPRGLEKKQANRSLTLTFKHF
jgi:hypothetical protein